MNPDFAQRRRVFVALAITVIAVPAAFLLNRGGSDDTTTPPVGTLVGTVPPAGATSGTAAKSGTDERSQSASSGTAVEDEVLGTTPTGYLDGTVPPGNADPPMIAIPKPRETLTGEATFSSAITNVAACFIPKAPMGVIATLTNLDNSRTVKCQVVAVAAVQPADAVLAPQAFGQIADITEAPVPVEISW
jgi:hypothetical protein